MPLLPGVNVTTRSARAEYIARWRAANPEKARAAAEQQRMKGLALAGGPAPCRKCGRDSLRYKSGACIPCRERYVAENHAQVIAGQRRCYAKKASIVSERGKVRRRTNPTVELWKKAKQRASAKGLEFSIDVSDIHVPETCPILGIALVIGSGCIHRGSPTLDRIRNEYGYTPDNVWVVSHRANSLKRDGTWQELLQVAEALRSKMESM